MGLLKRRGKAVIIYGTVAVLAAASACGTSDAPATSSVPDRTVVEGELAEQLDRILAGRSQAGFNGSVLIAKDGRVILHNGYGWADRQHEEPVTIATPFWIASISKQFAAAAVMKLEEQGRLSLQDSIARFFPAAPEDKRHITIHQLLTHTAGLARNYAADGIADRDEAVRSLLSQPLAAAPGEGFGYTNDAYNLIAAIVEVSSEQRYEDYLRGQLLAPAGLVHTGFWGPADHPEVAAITGDAFPDSSVALSNWGFRGGVGMHSTAGDLYRWYLALDGGRVLSADNKQRLLTAYVRRGDTGVGYGWFASPAPGNTVCYWTRGYEGFGHGAVLAVYPSDGVVIAVTSNSGERRPGDPESHVLAQELADSILIQ
jgi:CubicO group peptidase (beta-lactamase class C family)